MDVTSCLCIPTKQHSAQRKQSVNFFFFLCVCGLVDERKK